MLRAEIDTRRGALALTANDEVNYLFIQKVKEEAKTISLYAALTDSASLTVKMLHKSGAELVFGAPVDVDADPLLSTYSGNGLITVAVRRNGRLSPIGDGMRFKKEDEVYFFVFEPERNAADDFLDQMGWQCLDRIDRDAFTTSTCQLDPVDP